MALVNQLPYTTDDLQEINNKRLTGEQTQDNKDINLGADNSKTDTVDLQSTVPGNTGTTSFWDIMDASDAGAPIMPVGYDYAQDAIDAGWGKSRYDRRNPYMPGQDTEEARALEQTGFNKIVSGLSKGGVTALTTAANTVAGTVFGLGASMFELGKQVFDSNEKLSIGSAVGAGVNNWLSQRLINLQTASEDWFPNYKTEEERTDKYQEQWARHMLTPNFIGDSLLKNFGFTVGAMAGGVAWSRAMQSNMLKKMSGNILKASVAGAEGDATAYAEMKNIANAIRSGNIQTIDPDRLITSLENAAKQINKMDAKLQLYGSAIGAIGEGTTEGLMARQEFEQDANAQIENFKNSDISKIKEEILEEGLPEYVKFAPAIDEDGIPYSQAYLTEEGEREAYRRQVEEEAKYSRIKDIISKEGEKLASTTFLLNLPILTTSNLIQFGRMFSGGWTTATKNAAKVTGGIQRTVEEGAEKGTARGIGRLAANYKGLSNNKILPKSVLNGIKIGGTEAFEEMAQGAVSSGAKNVADDRYLASFYNDGYNANAVDSVREWFSSMTQGGREYLGDIKNWQEGALGALTGLFGIPGKVWKKGNRWNGGLYQAIKDAKADVAASQEAANRLNDIINSEDFQSRWHSYIRHLAYDNTMADAVLAKDQYAWQNANDKQLINDVMAFAGAGKLDDLNQIVRMYGNISEQDAAQLRSVLKSDESYSSTNENDILNMSDSEIVERVRKQANNISDTISQYKKVYDAIVQRLPVNTDKRLIDELVFTSMQIKNFENRFLTLLDETMEEIKPVLNSYKYTRADGTTITDEEEQNIRLEQLQSEAQNLFSKVDMPLGISGVMYEIINSRINELKNAAEKLGQKDAVNKIDDMQKLANARRAYYDKFVRLQKEDGQQKFEESAVSQEEIDEKREEEYSKVEVPSDASVSSIRDEYLSKTFKEKNEFLSSLRKRAKDNNVVKEAVQYIDSYNRFYTYVDKKGSNTNLSTLASNTDVSGAIGNRVIANTLGSIFRIAKSESELFGLTDSVFPSYAEWSNENKAPFGFQYSEQIYEAVKDIIRKLMAEYTKASNNTNTGKITSAPAKHSNDTDDSPSGTEPSQPSSVNPLPSSEQQNDENKKSAEEKPQVSVQYDTPEDEPEVSVPTISQELDITPMSEKPTVNELVSDASDAVFIPVEEEILSSDTIEQNNSDKRPYYNFGVPEIDSNEAAKARMGGESRRNADLSDLYIPEQKDENGNIIIPEKNPSFKALWTKIDSEGGFDTAAFDVSVGDEIEFVIYPNETGDISFPRFGRNPEIVLRLKRTGQIINTLPAKISSYYNLKELRDAIMSEYTTWRRDNPSSNDAFVFSKTSKVFAKRPGQIDYDYGTEGDGYKNETPINNIDGYREDAPIVVIDKEGVVRDSSGNKSNITITNSEDKKGNLYYMAPDGAGSYIPIRLFVEHFTPENKDSNSPLFNEVRNIINNIVDIAQSVSGDNLTQLSADSVEDANDKLHKEMEHLVRLIDLNHVWLHIGNYKKIGNALRIVTNVGVEGLEQESKAIRTSQVTVEKLIDEIANLRPSIQIGAKKNLSIKDYVENGYITSNARKLRPKGVDVYYEAWDGKDFGPVTDRQREAVARKEKEAEEKESLQYVDVSGQFAAEDIVSEYSATESEDYQESEEDEQQRNDEVMPEKTESNTITSFGQLFSAFSSGTGTEQNYVEQVDVSGNAGVGSETNNTVILFNDLDDYTKSGIITQKKISEEEFNNLSEEAKKHMISCFKI